MPDPARPEETAYATTPPAETSATSRCDEAEYRRLASGDATERIARRGYNACEREGLLLTGDYGALGIPQDWGGAYG